VVPARYLYFLRNALACHAPLYCREYDCRSERELGILYLQIASLNESHKLPDLIRLCFPLVPPEDSPSRRTAGDRVCGGYRSSGERRTRGFYKAARDPQNERC
jgi:hypothetical protein